MSEPRGPEVPTGLGGYDVVRRIAVGGMAEVILARHTVRPGIARMVVLKTILPGLSEQADLVTMFLSEARIAAQLQHPNVVHIHDVTRLGTRPCIVMEHLVGLDGRGLQRKLHERGEPLPIGIIAAIGEGAALGLGYAHRARGVDGQALSVVHRDVSPHNLFVTVDGVVKVLDFGIAKSTAQLQTTREGTLKGKIAYMSPEQLRGDVLDGRSDLFALGAVLWELATGQALFARGMEVESFAAVMEMKIPPPSTVRPDVPAAFDRAVMHALDRDRARRPATGEEMARELHAVAEATCDGPPGQAVAALVRALVGEDEAVDEVDPTDPMRAPTMTLASPASSAPSGPLSPPRGEGGGEGTPSFEVGELHIDGSDQRRSSYPERAPSVAPDVRDRFDLDGEDVGMGSSPRVALAVDVELERRAMGRAIPDRDRRAAAVADFGAPPFLLLTPLYALRVMRRRAALATRAKELQGELPALEAELRAARAAIGSAVRDGAGDHRISGEVSAVERAADRLASVEEKDGRARRDAEVALEERLADLGHAAVSRVAGAKATAPLEAAAQTAARRLDAARTELELCVHGRELHDAAAVRSGWVISFLVLATITTLLLPWLT